MVPLSHFFFSFFHLALCFPLASECVFSLDEDGFLFVLTSCDVIVSHRHCSW